jgi:hypothetical protein
VSDGGKDVKDEAQEKLAAGGIPLGRYQHYKGPFYDVFGLSIDEVTLEPLVHYRSLAHGTSWTRTVKNFTEDVEVDGKKVQRFKLAVPENAGFWSKAWAWMKVHLTNSWMASNGFDSTMAHIGWAALLVFATAIVSIALIVGIPPGILPACGWCSGGLVIFAAGKEFIFDPAFEIPKQTIYPDGVQDFAGYIGGIALAWGVILLSMHLHHG